MKSKIPVVALSLLAMLCMCHFGTKPSNRLAYVGATLLTQEDADAFATVSRLYPNSPEEFSLAGRAPIGALVETQAIYRKARWKPASLKYHFSKEWQWKERYFVAFLFMEEILRQNLGYTDNQLKGYYRTHRVDFSTINQHDSAGKKRVDTVPIPFEDAKRSVAEKMFLGSHQPDSAFRKMLAVHEPERVNQEWVRYVYDGAYRDLFLKEYYREAYGKPFPDSLKDLVGKGKIVSNEDLNIILSWLPPDRREQFKNNPEGLKDFAAWLARWKLFSAKAATMGYASTPKVRNVLKWAWRFELTQRYHTAVLGPTAKRDIRIDSAMARYSCWDETETPASFDSAQFKSHCTKLVNREIGSKFDSLVYEIRRRAGVRFLKSDWSDDLVKNPAIVLRQADSLRDTGKSAEAENLYRMLVDNFVFTKEGKKALLELAKIKTEQQMYSDAIQNYRRFLTIDADTSKESNTMFMIGFIYDEYLNKPDLAEINYKWVLKNAPRSELSDDAEFMMLHLGEQMASVDELQAEVKRQGKKVEAGSESDSTGLKVESVQGNTKKG